MRGRLRNIGTWMLVLWLVIPLSGCDTAVSEAAGSRVTEEMMPKVAQMVDAQLPTIREYAGDEFEENGSKALDGVTGEEVVQGTLTEEHGREYIAFAYQVDESETREDADKVVDSAKDLLSKEDFAQLEDQITEQKELMLREAAEQAKDIAPSLKPAFYKDLQKVRRGRSRRRFDDVAVPLLPLRRHEGGKLRRMDGVHHDRAESRVHDGGEHDQRERHAQALPGVDRHHPRRVLAVRTDDRHEEAPGPLRLRDHQVEVEEVAANEV